MADLQFQRPRALRAAKRTRIVLVGGFLGAGKTTALGSLAAELVRRGLKPAFVTNDQASNLVDTATLTQMSEAVAEVAGGCFCCRFTDLLDAVQGVLEAEPDVLLCEPVGSCTDMAATVMAPLRYFYPDLFKLAPFAVVVDPERAREAVLGEAASPFPPEVAYIFRKQLEESDLIVLNKADTLMAPEVDRLASELSSRCGKPVIPISALRGQGVADWADAELQAHEAGRHILREMDYDTYARGEAVLGWLNATVDIEGRPLFEARDVVMECARELQARAGRAGAEIAHLKLGLLADGALVRAHLTRTEAEPFVAGAALSAGSGRLTVNARVHIDPGMLGAAVVEAVHAVAMRLNLDATVASLQAFGPGYPRPPYRMEATK